MYDVQVLRFMLSLEYTSPNARLCDIGELVMKDALSSNISPLCIVRSRMARQCYGEDRALHPRGSPTIGNGQCAMMLGYDTTGDEQAEAAPAAVRAVLSADKWLENSLHIGL